MNMDKISPKKSFLNWQFELSVGSSSSPVILLAKQIVKYKLGIQENVTFLPNTLAHAACLGNIQ